MSMETDMWERNDNTHLADIEDELTRELIIYTTDNMAYLIRELGISLTGEYQKSWIKRIKQRISEGKSTQRVINYFQNLGKKWTENQLKVMDWILDRNKPKWRELAERVVTKTGVLSKIKARLDREETDINQAKISELPETLEKAKRKIMSITVEGKEIKIDPLTKDEEKVLLANIERCGDKLKEVSKRQKEKIKEILKQAVVEKWSALRVSQELMKATGDHQRDWRTVAITELAMASTDAFIASQKDGLKVTVPALAGACKYCVQLLEGKTFILLKNPPATLTPEHAEKYLWVGKTNYGRTSKNYIPCIPLHPRCRHYIVPVGRD